VHVWPDNTLIVAELSCNHRGIYEEAVDLIKDAEEAGADAVKIQLYRPDTMTLNLARFGIKEGEWAGRTLHDLYEEAQTPWSWAHYLQREAEQRGLKFIASIYDPSSLDFAERNLDCWAYKISSFELTDIHLIKRVARTNKLVIVSTGMASEQEIMSVMNLLDSRFTAYLHCVTAYPTPVEEMRLNRIAYWKEVGMTSGMELRIGLSDHSLSTEVPALAVAAGARIVEKHLTLSRGNGSLDSAFSLEPDEFSEMVHNVRRAEAILGDKDAPYERAGEEAHYRQYRRSTYTIRDVEDGEELTPENVRTLRADGGVTDITKVWGLYANKALERGSPVTRKDLRS
jgi:sialic acid synthase SpsE